MRVTKILCASIAMALMLGIAQAGENKPQALPKSDAKPLPAKSKGKSPADQAPAKVATKIATAPEEKVVDGVKMAEIEVNLVSYTNEQRARYGLPPLAVDKELMQTAREHTSWMTRVQSLRHTNRPVAENIAMGQTHSSEAVQSWMNSPGHRANILNPGHGRIGVAAFRTASGTIFWCQQFRR